jgi:BON domain
VYQKDNATDECCEWCGHIRSERCPPDRWLQLADGCCNCLRHILRKAQGRVLAYRLKTFRVQFAAEPAEFPAGSPCRLSSDVERVARAIYQTLDAERNEVTLSGTVRSRAAWEKAIELAKSAKPGVLVNDKIDC